MLVFTLDRLSNNRILKEYYKAHGCRTEGDKVIIPMRCPKLTEDNLCSIHDHKPLICKAWNGEKRSNVYIPKGCVWYGGK